MFVCGGGVREDEGKMDSAKSNLDDLKHLQNLYSAWRGALRRLTIATTSWLTNYSRGNGMKSKLDAIRTLKWRAKLGMSHGEVWTTLRNSKWLLLGTWNNSWNPKWDLQLFTTSQKTLNASVNSINFEPCNLSNYTSSLTSFKCIQVPMNFKWLTPLLKLTLHMISGCRERQNLTALEEKWAGLRCRVNLNGEV